MAMRKERRFLAQGSASRMKFIPGIQSVFFLAFFLIAGLAAGAWAARPIKIGFIAPHTGNFAQMGMDMVDGFKMYLQEINYTVGDRKIELIVEDEGDTPATAVTKARKLITQDKVGPRRRDLADERGLRGGAGDDRGRGPPGHHPVRRRRPDPAENGRNTWPG